MDLLHTTALCNLALFGSIVGATVATSAVWIRSLKRDLRNAQSDNDDLAASNVDLHAAASTFYAEAMLNDDKLVNAEAMIEELKVDMGDLSQELAAAKVEMAETNAVCDAYAKQCQTTDDVAWFLTGVLNNAGIAYLAPSALVEAQTESLVRVGLRACAKRGPGALGLASDLEQAA